MELVAGQSLGRYEITGHLGAGGMGVVYRARDAQLGREVAVKVLNDRAASQPSRIERFAREAQAVARLSHPNILAIHDFGTHEGIAYAVTELLQGQTLADRIHKGQIPLNKGLEICRAIAEGLAAAHGEGIIHRDIKPSNIFITSTGQVKILDFGIARLREQPADESSPGSMAPTESLTGAAGMIGTVGYMSPEQIDGKPVDGRSDIFGLGCVMYEILTGKRAFRGKTSTDTMLAILGKDPEPIRVQRPEVPQPVELIVERCLEKQPGERFESARDIAFALQAITDIGRTQSITNLDLLRRTKRRRVFAGMAIALAAAVALIAVSYRVWRTPPPLPGIKHLAVVPFSASGEAPQVQESAAGLTRVVASKLSLIEQESRGVFWVVPYREAESRGADTAQNAHRAFGVTIALLGRLQSSGDRLRLDLEAVDAATGQSLRRSSIEDSVSNLASFQEEPVLRICEMLDIPVNPEARERLASTATTMPEGYELYLRGVGVLATEAEDEDALDRAIGMFETATSLDPLFATGRVALGRTYLRKHEASKSQDWIERAAAEAERAAKDGQWPEDAYDLLADVHTVEGRLPEAVASLEEATRVAPESAEAHLKLARGYQKLGRSEDAERHFQRAIFLRPGYWPAYNRLAQLYLDQGKYEAAATQYREVIAFAPQLTRGYNNLGAVLSFLGRVDEARDMFERSIVIEPSRSALSNLGTLYFDGRRFADAAAMFERAIEEDDSNYLTWGNLAYAYKFGPAPEKADKCFLKAVELGENQLQSDPRNLWVVTDLAAYNAMLGERERGLELVEQAVAEDPESPQLIAQIAETFEDLGDRERALLWVARSLDAGLSPERFEDRPTLRELVADERYQLLVQEMTDHS